ncbi:hypothetical protein BofuT4_uP141860.1 [Botrytis cinerea T4]|uniref:Uncharacterized protein n=1 Tax=Botryotinia fuckeliana (strain T4) TaxID=999810 RepID=G2YZ76_BOTF4|nr:hypothetical protein BofuT4_uP141860.1 [Botrytis cinerea T4]
MRRWSRGGVVVSQMWGAGMRLYFSQPSHVRQRGNVGNAEDPLW